MRRPIRDIGSVFYADLSLLDDHEAPPLLRVDAGVRREWPREGGFLIDTFAGLVTKDMGMDPDTTITLTVDEKRSRLDP